MRKGKTTHITLLFPGIVLIAAAAWILFSLQERGLPRQAAATDAGLPQSKQAGPVTVLRNKGFVVGYSERRRNPLWVTFKLQPLGPGRLPPRPRFETDPRSPAAVTHGDFYGGGYDRGHMAPNYSIARLYGRDAQGATFLMTNIVPQRARLNQLVWQRIEEAEIDVMARRWHELWVTTGPVFDADRQRLSSGVDIPDMFYRLWLDITASGQPRVLALLVPQAVRGDEPLTAFITTVDRVEELTGLDFYSDLTPAEQARIESRRANPEDWAFDVIACTPARYHSDWQGKNGIKLRYDRCN